MRSTIALTLASALCLCACTETHEEAGTGEGLDTIAQPRDASPHRDAGGARGTPPSADASPVEDAPTPPADALQDGTGVGGDAPTRQPPQADALQLEPDPVDFGELWPDAPPTTLILTAHNGGFAPLTVVAITKQVDDPAFSINRTSLALEGKASAEVEVTFTPGGVAEHEDALVFHLEDGSTASVALRAKVVEPVCTDYDGDGYGPGCAAGADCDDTNPKIHPYAAERCNASDDDCDGLVDEDFVQLGQVCTGGLGACATTGAYVCAADGLGVVCSADVPGGVPELCNGLDDDCDGAVDEDFPKLGELCSVGVGACKRVDKYVCSADHAHLVCNTEPGPPSPEVCFDGIDNDCDGIVDEGTIEQCDNGVDDDCDGLTDETGSTWGEVFFARSAPGGGVLIYRSNGDGTFADPIAVDFPDDAHYGINTVGDFDGDGYLDLIVVRVEVGNQTTCTKQADCGPQEKCWFGICKPTCPLVGMPCALPGDVCVDGNPTHVDDTFCRSPRQVMLAQDACDGGVKLTELFDLPPDENLAVPVDADANGHLDFAVLAAGDSGVGKIWLNDGAMNFTKVDPAFDFSPLITWSYRLGQTSRDYTGDGRVDLLGVSFTSGGSPPGQLWLFVNQGDGTFAPPIKLPVQTPYPANLLAGNDFDGDGDHDIVAGLDDDGQPGAAWAIVHQADAWSQPVPVFDVAPSYNGGGEAPGIGNGASFDFDGDHLPDILAAWIPEECGYPVWGCPSVTNPADLCYGGLCRKVALFRNRTAHPCGVGESCVAGQCVPGCTPQCSGKECGDDGCGGSCGTCGPGQMCVAGQCKVDCTPQCAGKECGDNGCGGVCGVCAPGDSCVGGQCMSGCVPDCKGKQCGDDGCGGLCPVFGDPEIVEFSDNPSVWLAVPMNVPPTAPGIAVLPADPAPGEALQCAVVEASYDLDPVQYHFTWWRNGAFAADIGDSANVPAGVTKAGETWQCEVRATDGIEWSVPASVQVTVSGGGNP